MFIKECTQIAAIWSEVPYLRKLTKHMYEKNNWMWKMGGAALLGLLWPMFILYNFIPLISSLQIALWKTVNRNYANYWQLLISCMSWLYIVTHHCYWLCLLLITIFCCGVGGVGWWNSKTTFFLGSRVHVALSYVFQRIAFKSGGLIQEANVQ